MARNLNAVVLALLAVATLLHGSAAQTRHVVGDSTGWTIPSAGAAFYTNWASNKTFTVGDTLVFNFATNQHNVAKVSKSAYDACNGGNPISMITNGPATVTLNETGEQHYICTVGTHCSLGQKLSINVVNRASTSPAPSPRSRVSPPPRTSPSPQAQAPSPTTTSPPPSAPTAPSPSSTTTSPPPSTSTPTTPSPSSPTNPSSLSPTGSASPPPENSGAVSLGAFGLFATLFSIAAAFFY